MVAYWKVSSETPEVVTPRGFWAVTRWKLSGDWWHQGCFYQQRLPRARVSASESNQG